MRPRCEVCKKSIKEGAGERLFFRPNGAEVWLCGRLACEQKYNDWGDKMRDTPRLACEEKYNDGETK